MLIGGHEKISGVGGGMVHDDTTLQDMEMTVKYHIIKHTCRKIQ